MSKYKLVYLTTDNKGLAFEVDEISDLRWMCGAWKIICRDNAARQEFIEAAKGQKRTPIIE